MTRPERLVYTGGGKAFRFGVPARDLEAKDIRRLSDRTLAEITAPSPATGRALYEEPARPAARRARPAAETEAGEIADEAAAGEAAPVEGED